MEHGKLKNILSVIDELTAGQAEKLAKALQNRGDLDDVQRLIEERLADDLKCTHCGGRHIQRWGTSHGLQRYHCKDCRKTFNALTGTPLAGLRKKERWLEFAATLKEGLPVRKAAARCNVAKNTSFRWRHRFLEAQKDVPNQKLEGVVEVDEIFFRESRKGSRKLARKARKRGRRAKKRGLSAEQIPVLIARDRHGSHIDAVLPDRSAASVGAVLKGRISRDTLMCMDSDAAVIAFAEKQGIEYETIIVSKGEHVAEGVIHVQNVNAYAARLKKWMRRFNGVATEYLPRYLGWRRLLDLKEDILTPENLFISVVC